MSLLAAARGARDVGCRRWRPLSLFSLVHLVVCDNAEGNGNGNDRVRGGDGTL